jgi:hypothetical protein
MQITRKSFLSVAKWALCATLALGAVQLWAEDKKPEAPKADPTGTWVWTMPGRNGGPDRTNTLELKLEGEKLTGTVANLNRQGEVMKTPISEASFKADQVAFTLTREFNGNKMVIKYSGKIEGDVIKGKSEFERNGESQSRDWEAKRQAEKK